jgi:hypothetical protein
VKFPIITKQDLKNILALEPENLGGSVSRFQVIYS